MYDYVFIFDTDKWKVPEPFGYFNTFLLIQMVTVYDVLNCLVPAKVMSPAFIFKTCIESVLQNNVMVSYDSSEVILIHEKSQCLNGIFSAITEITDGIEHV